MVRSTASPPDKPADIFDRDAEWDDLTRFATDQQPGATLGVVTGRRRQGKTLLLYQLCRALDGFYFGATEATEAESLRRLARQISQHVHAPAPMHLDDWEQAIDALLALGRERPVTVVVDEFPYLARVTRSLPSVIQHAFTPGRAERTGSQARILLCGSALSFMGGLLAGSAPLRGRAGLELAVAPLDYRLAARFWGLDDPWLAVRVFSIVGGTPAYRREYVQDDTPDGPEDFDDWVARTALNPGRPLLREARYLLAEEPDLREPALYHSVLAAVAEGNATRGGIASYIGRKATDVQHPLTVLEDAGLLTHEQDLLRPGRGTYRIVEPLVTFYESVMRPAWTELERRRGAAVWRRSQDRYASTVVGPCFEELVRCWARQFAAPATFGGVVAEVGRGTITDPAGRTTIELDLIALGEPASRARPRPLLAVGETNWGKRLGASALGRLDRARQLLANRPGVDTTRTRLVLSSGGGFTDEVREESHRRGDEVILVDPDRLYRGE